jgi:hypothetical protein
MATIRASELGLVQADRARRQKGWLKQAEIWCRQAQTSRATLKRFWRRDAIDQTTFIDICQAVGLSDWQALAEPETAAAPNLRLNLSAMPDVPLLLGRIAELAHLHDLSQSARVIALWGGGGIGKTALVVEWIDRLLRSGQAAGAFEAVHWQSLQSQPSLKTLAQSLAELLEEAPQSAVVPLLQRRSVLLVLDHWEALLGGASAGQVKPEMAEFSQLFQQLGTMKHQSCVIVISREKPAELLSLEGLYQQVKSYKLGGMAAPDAIALLQHHGLREEPAAWQALIQLYRGHPLALHMMASLIQDVCQGSAAEFLKLNTIVVHQLDNVLTERIHCLSADELAVLKLLAQIAQPISRELLQQQIGSKIGQSQLIGILLSLERRCLLEIISAADTRFALAPVVQKYIQHLPV